MPDHVQRDEDGAVEVVDLDQAHEPAASTTGARPRQTPPPASQPEPGGGGGVLVDSAVEPSAAALPERLGSVRRSPVVAGWARSPEQLAAVARWAVGHVAHTVSFHLLRVPLYLARLAGRAPAGAARAVGLVGRWLADAEGMPARRAAVQAGDLPQYLKLSAQRDRRVQGRFLIALATASAAVWLFASAPPAARVALLALLVGLAGVAGTPGDRPLVGPAVVTTRVARLTSGSVIAALGSLGLAEINKALARGGGKDWFPAPITRDGPGWRADVDLPLGVTVTDVMDRRERLASGLRRPLGCVWPEPAHDAHAGRLVLWVGDQDMSQARPAAWPLARAGQVDLFRPVLFGTDPRGRPVTVPLLYANVLIGAMPGAGKTFALRVLLLAGALDARAELRTFELKGSGDLSPLERVAYRYGSGPDDATVEQVMASLREVHRDLEVRARTIRGLPREQAPENKVTPALAARRSLGLHPLVVAIDECQELFTHPAYGKEAGELCTAIIKRGRALGVILILATQRPDKDSLPTGVSANVGVRFCLRVMGQVENDMVLGTSAYRNGVRATTFTARDRGIGWLVGAADEPQVVRAAYLDGPAAERICDRARALRAGAGTLSGHAAGEAPDTTATVSLLDDVLAVVPAGQQRVWSETVCERLAELRPEVYHGWGAEQLAAALKPHGIDTDQIARRIDGRTINRRGITRHQIADTITNRNRRNDPG